MTDESTNEPLQQQPAAEPEKPPRQKPGRKPGQPQKKHSAPAPTTGPVRNVSMNPAPGGQVIVRIEMELPMAIGIELLTAAADIQTRLESGEKEPRASASPFPGTAVAKPSTRWMAPNKQEG